jgi:hypothetical protein
MTEMDNRLALRRQTEQITGVCIAVWRHYRIFALDSPRDDGQQRQVLGDIEPYLHLPSCAYIQVVLIFKFVYWT